MTRCQVTLIKFEMLLVKFSRKRADNQVLITSPCADLVSGRFEPVDWNANRYTGRTVRAIRLIQVFSTASESVVQQGTIEPPAFRKMGICKQGYGLLAGQVTTIMGWCGIEAEFMRDFSHGCTGSTGQSQVFSESQ